MPQGPTPRQRARADNIARIKELALGQLAESGAADLSLRAIARELNLVSSAIYRYFPSRDELITALIVDAYNDLAASLEAAGSTRAPHRVRWSAVTGAFRSWAREQPHRFALVYGSAIPGYRAPGDTIEPAARVVRAFCAPAVRGPGARLPGGAADGLAGQLDVFADAVGVERDPDAVLDLAAAFARMVGAVQLELNGHFVGTFEPADALFSRFAEREADALGL
ncbi:TetR/AcrR family transcriptional regulator [Zafaria sp. J156]|uniref:TetR/AcrR family transcriptional regulator n=1 Tax=Zafaria sp. J156 TaxID=3116490 RepID=UPI002E78483F|nr:TetR/AcrR family transcriptional regulator [Zafaria sp. J156]MEE1620976.1 TetR/AcrR family transcriptional regulator [Zafaria sp. J156]